MLTFSIIIPCYPPHFHLLDRLINQINNFTKSSEYTIKEIIISASETVEINIKTLSQYPIVCDLTTLKCNAATNRNRGWNKAQGEWIVFLDCDDYYHCDKILITFRAITQYPEIDCVVHNFIISNHMESKDLKPIDSFRVIPSERIFKSTFPDKKYIECNPYMGGCNIKFNTDDDIQVAHGITTVRTSTTIRFDETKDYGEDGEFCRKYVFQNKLIALSAILMVYNLTH